MSHLDAVNWEIRTPYGYGGNNGLVGLLGNTTNELFNFAGNTVNATLNFANQTVNTSFGALNNILYGNGNGNLYVDSGLSREQGGSGAFSVGSSVNALGGFLGSLSKASNDVGDLLLQLSGPIRAMEERNRYRDMMWYGSPWYFPNYEWGAYGSRWTTMLNSPAFGANPWAMGPMGNNNPLAPAGRSTSLSDVLYGKDDSKKTAQKPKDAQEETVTSDTNGNAPPDWYTRIVAKAKKGKKLTETEAKLKASYEKLAKKYAITDSDGQYTSFAREISELDSLIKNGGYGAREAIKAKLKSYPPEKLAAIETWYSSVTKQSLRDTIKQNIILGKGWVSWTGYNTDASLEMFDILDQAAVKANPNPISIAASLTQALKNHRMLGFGGDHDRVLSLLRLAKGNPELIDAIKESYGTTLETDIMGKWFMDKAVKDECLAILNEAHLAAQEE